MNTHRIKQICFFIFFILLFGTIHNNAHAQISKKERAALIDFYKSTNGDSWKDNSGWKTKPLDLLDGFAKPGTEGSWFGVTLNPFNDSVEQLSFGRNNLSGKIPSTLGRLTKLRWLNLSINQLSGEIPSELGGLMNLQELYLSNTQLSGKIPSTIGDLTNLKVLHLSYNQLSGKIPSTLGGLINLQWLDLSGNQLSGKIPSELGGLANLQYLYLSQNPLSGEIPSELGGLMNLQELSLSYTQLSGEMPSVLGGLINLQRLDLSYNHLSGKIPSVLGGLTNLQYLYLYGNQLSGEIPSELGNLLNLIGLYIGYNGLYTENESLRAFLESKCPNWEDTQTIQPGDVTLDDPVFDTSVQISWTPITYTNDTGGYHVFYSTSPGGPYTLLDTTANKSADQMEVTSLDPDTTYYFVVQTYTDSHMNNWNVVESEYSEEVCGGLDTDDDGTADCMDPDDDNDGMLDNQDAFPLDPSESIDTDRDRIGNNADTDDDNDGVLDNQDTFPLDPSESIDTDRDGIGNNADTDDDNDGVLDNQDTFPLDSSQWQDSDNDDTAENSDLNDDQDGISEAEENAGPNNGDGNKDGILDSTQGHVASFQAYDGQTYVTLETPVGTILNSCHASSVPADAPTEVEFPYGLFDFTITSVLPGGATTITIYLPAEAAPTTYYKYGPTPDDSTDHWYEFLYDGETGAQINGNLITLYFVDGKRGDDDFDGTNGIIVDQGGPAETIDSVPAAAPAGDSGGGGGGCFVASTGYSSKHKHCQSVFSIYFNRIFRNK